MTYEKLEKANELKDRIKQTTDLQKMMEKFLSWDVSVINISSRDNNHNCSIKDEVLTKLLCEAIHDVTIEYSRKLDEEFINL